MTVGAAWRSAGLAALVLAACGGGGGGGDDDGTPTDAANAADTATVDAPVIDALAVDAPVDAPAIDAPMITLPFAQEAYVKAVSPDAADDFGHSIALSADGSTLAIGAWEEDGNGTGTTGDPADDSASGSGAVYVYRRVGSAWQLEAYVKASNTEAGDNFGNKVALSSSGDTLAVSAHLEDSAAVGVAGNQLSNGATNSGAVYVFQRAGTTWTQEAYLKASNTAADDFFGNGGFALSADGHTLAVAAPGEDGSATGVGGNEASDLADHSGAVYVFRRGASVWAQEAYVKATNTAAGDDFGAGVALSDDGDTLAVGAYSEDGASPGVGGSQASNAATDSGAVYVYRRSGTTWAPEAYVKATNPGGASGQRIGDHFGGSVALSADGDVLAVGAQNEDSAAAGVGGNQNDNNAASAGAVYTYTRTGTAWAPGAYLKASNPDAQDLFGYAVSLSADGQRLVVGAPGEDSAATTVGGDQASNGADYAGAVYVFARVGGTWAQGAYVKAANTDAGDRLGFDARISRDGLVVIAGAIGEASAAGFAAPAPADDSAAFAGAVYVLR